MNTLIYFLAKTFEMAAHLPGGRAGRHWHIANFVRALARLATVLTLGILISSCEKPIDNPELADNIYNDLIKDAKANSAAVEEEKKVLQGLEDDIVATKLGDNSAKSKFRKKYDTEAKIQVLSQKARYFSLRALKRKEYVEHTYPKYFEKHLHWPDAEEWSDYQASKRLSTASRDWNQRVPRLSKRIKSYADSAASAYSGAKKESSGKKETPDKAPPGESAPAEKTVRAGAAE